MSKTVASAPKQIMKNTMARRVTRRLAASTDWSRLDARQMSTHMRPTLRKLRMEDMAPNASTSDSMPRSASSPPAPSILLSLKTCRASVRPAPSATHERVESEKSPPRQSVEQSCLLRSRCTRCLSNSTRTTRTTGSTYSTMMTNRAMSGHTEAAVKTSQASPLMPHCSDGRRNHAGQSEAAA
eukprot:2254378-Prymnesium_polylepis.3